MEEKKLSLGEHLEELRTRLIYSTITFLVALVISFIFQEEILRIIIGPHFKASANLPLEALKYQERFFVYLKGCLISALLLSAPFIIYHLWRFISAGLYQHEKKYVLLYLPCSLLLFASGVLFSYFIFLPVMLKFLANYGDVSLIANKFNLSYYFDLFILLTFMMGVVFQLPLLMLFLVQVKICTPKTYTGNLRISILLAFIIGAIITPGGDPVSQIMLAIPLLLLYFIGILLSSIYYKTPNK